MQLVLAVALLLCSPTVTGDNPDVDKIYAIDIPQSNADQALKTLAHQTGVQVLVPFDLVKAIDTRPISGNYSVMTALAVLLYNTGLSGILTDSGVITISQNGSASRINQNGKGKSMNTTNSSKRKTVLAGLVGLFAAGGMTQAVAQGGEAATGQSAIDEIIVTANKREQSLREVPMSVAAISGEDLSSQGIDGLQALSLAVPGLYANETGDLIRNISIRGIGNLFGVSPLVGVYVDESPVVGHGLGQLDLRIFDLERVEVLKGPQGTLYGEGSVGGTIRYITKNPELDEFGGEFEIDGSSIKNGDVSHEVKGVLNIPLATDNLGLRIATRYTNGGGWIDQPALSKSDINAYELFNTRGKLLWQPTDKLAVTTTVIVHRNNKNLGPGEDENRNFQQRFNDPTTPSFTDDYEVYNLLVNYDFGDISLVSTTTKMNSERRTTNLGKRCCFLNSGGSTSEDLFEILYDSNDFSMDVLSQEFRLSSNDSGDLHWSAGLFAKEANYVPFWLHGDEGIRFGPFVIPEIYEEIESTSWAVFGEASYAMTDRFEVGVGIRAFEDDHKYRNGRTLPFQDTDFDTINPRLYISYDLTNDVHLYANAAKGFRSGGLNGSGLPSYAPESVWSYEMGSKISSMDGYLSAELAVFYTKYDDYQIFGLNLASGGVAPLTSNAGKAEVSGVDLYLRYRVADHLELGFTGNYTDSELVESVSNIYAEGDPLDYVAQYGFSLWTNYSFNWSDHASGYVRLDYNRQGKAHSRNRSFDVPSLGFEYHGTSDVIDMLNARVGWERESWTMALYGKNLLDDEGFLGPDGFQLVSARPQPRTIGFNVGYSF